MVVTLFLSFSLFPQDTLLFILLQEFLTWCSLYFLFFLTRYAFIYLFLQRIPSYKLIILFNWR